MKRHLFFGHLEFPPIGRQGNEDLPGFGDGHVFAGEFQPGIVGGSGDDRHAVGEGFSAIGRPGVGRLSVDFVEEVDCSIAGVVRATSGRPLSGTSRRMTGRVSLSVAAMVEGGLTREMAAMKKQMVVSGEDVMLAESRDHRHQVWLTTPFGSSHAIALDRGSPHRAVYAPRWRGRDCLAPKPEPKWLKRRGDARRWIDSHRFFSRVDRTAVGVYSDGGCGISTRRMVYFDSSETPVSNASANCVRSARIAFPTALAAARALRAAFFFSGAFFMIGLLDLRSVKIRSKSALMPLQVEASRFSSSFFKNRVTRRIN